MAIKTMMTKRGRFLEATWSHALDALQNITDGSHVRVEITCPRNLKQHKLLFALLQKCLEAQNEPRVFHTTEHLLRYLKRAMGYFTVEHDPDGNPFIVVKSIDFATLDQHEFNPVFDRMINVILSEIIPRVNRQDFEREIYNMLGERGPDDR